MWSEISIHVDFAMRMENSQPKGAYRKYTENQIANLIYYRYKEQLSVDAVVVNKIKDKWEISKNCAWKMLFHLYAEDFKIKEEIIP